MEDLPSNSRTTRDEPARAEKAKDKLEKVVQGEVVRRKTPLGRKFRETFVGGDARSVWSYVFLDVLVPAAKDMVADAMSTGVERMLFGESRGGFRGRSRGGGSRNGHVAYNKFSSGGRRPPFDPDEPRNMSRRGRATHDFDEIILESRAEAEEVIDTLLELLSKYDMATVADLYDLVGVSGNFVDEKWGWTDLRGARVERVRGGFLLDLPKPESIN